MRNRKWLMAAFGVVVFSTIIFLGWRRHGPNSFEAAFQPGGHIVLDLSIGGFTIQGTNENQIRVEVSQADLPYVHSEVIASGNTAKVSLDGPSDNFHATIYVPQQSNISASQTIGDLRVVNVEGDKDLGLNIGNVRVEVPDPAKVRAVDASVRLGDVHAAAWREGHGGFFPSFHAKGTGNHFVNASVDIGHIELSN